MRHAIFRCVTLFIALASGAGTSASAQVTGVLLGIADRGWSHGVAERLTTVWLVRDGGGAARTTSMRGLIVPVGSSFRRVLIARECERRGGSEADPDIACVDSLIVGPAPGRKPRVSRESAASACTTDQLGIAFASPQILSVTYYGWYADCEHRSWADQNARRTWDWSMKAEIPFATLGPGAADAYERAARDARNVNLGSDGESSAPQDDACHTRPDEDTAWTIRRDRTRWVADLYQQNGNELCLLEAPIDWTLPSRVLGYTEPSMDWAAVAAALPDAESAWLSPDGSMLVVTLPKVIRVYAMKAGAPSTMLFERARTTAEGTDVVMVQWASGSWVARWAANLAAVR